MRVRTHWCHTMGLGRTRRIYPRLSSGASGGYETWRNKIAAPHRFHGEEMRREAGFTETLAGTRPGSPARGRVFPDSLCAESTRLHDDLSRWRGAAALAVSQS